MKLLNRIVSICGLASLLAANAWAVDKPAVFEDVKLKLSGEYLAYGKYFKERDINGYNGNLAYFGTPADGSFTLTDRLHGGTPLQTDEVEAWLEHELKLRPTLQFNENIEFGMTLKAGGEYPFSSDQNDSMALKGYTDLPDRSKLEVEDAYLFTVTPVGAFVFGRFEGGNNGLVWAVQHESIPGWTIALAWNKKNEGRVKYEDADHQFYHPYTWQRDYLDRDDQNEFSLITLYENEELGLTSQQWLDMRQGLSKSEAMNMDIFLPQWNLSYDKNNWHIKFALGAGFGDIAELPNMPEAAAIRELADLGTELANSLGPNLYYFPYPVIEDMGPVNGETFVTGMTLAYDIDKFTPDFGWGYTTGGETFSEVSAFFWESYDPTGGKEPGWFHTVLLDEIEDKYYPFLSTYATQQAFTVDDICYQNMKFLKTGLTYRPTPKWEVWGQVFSAWRSNTKYFEKNHWDFFPLNNALANMTDTSVPLTLMRKDTVYYNTDIDPYLGTELDFKVTYKLHEGLDMSFLAAYFAPGGFYEDVLSPKRYYVQDANPGTSAPVPGHSPYNTYGPIPYAVFDMTPAWTVQWMVDFKFDTTLID